jgi:hypothetical protein
MFKSFRKHPVSARRGRLAVNAERASRAGRDPWRRRKLAEFF